MLTPELAAIVARIATTMSDNPTPTTAEVLMALNEVAEAADRVGFARGVIQGQNGMAALTQAMLRMSAP